MSIEEIIIIGYIVYPSGLFILFIVNLIHFSVKKDEPRDAIFEYSEFNYTYESVMKRLQILESFLGTKLESTRAKLEQYRKNSVRTKRPYIKFLDPIEDGFVILYAKKGGDKPVKFLFDDLSKMIKFEVFYTTLFYPFVFIFILTYIGNEYIILKVLLGAFYLFIIYMFWLVFTKFIITVKYGLIGMIFKLFKKPTGALRRNVNLLDYLYHTSHFNMVMLKMIYVSFLVSLGFGQKASAGGFKGFKGFKGGRFGGGGAGGAF